MNTTKKLIIILLILISTSFAKTMIPISIVGDELTNAIMILEKESEMQYYLATTLFGITQLAEFSNIGGLIIRIDIDKFHKKIKDGPCKELYEFEGYIRTTVKSTIEGNPNVLTEEGTIKVSMLNANSAYYFIIQPEGMPPLYIHQDVVDKLLEEL